MRRHPAGLLGKTWVWSQHSPRAAQVTFLSLCQGGHQTTLWEPPEVPTEGQWVASEWAPQTTP